MLSTNRIKTIRQLHQKKFRQKYHKFIVEGEKSVAELVQQERFEVLELYGTADFFKKNNLPVDSDTYVVISEAELKKLSLLKTPNKAFAVLALPERIPDFSFCEKKLCFYLDNLRDPGNVGTVLRIADWFGMPAVYCSKGTADAFSPKVIQASMGAFLRVRIFEVEEEQLPKMPIFGAVMEGDSLFSIKEKPENGLLVLGNEGYGISPAIEAQLTQRLTIPRAPQGGAESLNAGVAAGIFAALLS